jgi:hypothetical protein
LVVVVVGSIGSASSAVDTAKPEQFHALSFHFSINSLVEHYAKANNCVWNKTLPKNPMHSDDDGAFRKALPEGCQKASGFSDSAVPEER